MLLLARIKSVAGILNLNKNLVLISCRLNKQLAQPGRGQVHGFNAVHDQVNHDLLQLDEIAIHVRKFGLEIGSQADAVTSQLAMQ